jgi:uncharacterized protein YbaP (TraB family)
MKNLTIVAAILFVAIGQLSNSCGPKPAKEGYLWEISGNGLVEPSWLFGTFHGSFDILYNYIDSIPGYHEAFERARLVVGEIDPDNMPKRDPEADKKVIEPLPADSTYRELLSPADYRYLDSIVTAISKELGVDPARAMEMRPTLLTRQIYVGMQMADLKRKGMAPDKIRGQVMDFQIMKVAKERSKARAALDTEDTFRMASSFVFSSGKSLREDAGKLILTLKQWETTSPGSVASGIVSAYRSGELSEMERHGAMLDSLMESVLTAEELKSYNSAQDYLERGRNEVWMEKIPEMIAAGPTFIAVGARHLPGNTGLIEMLRKKGYTVTPAN